MQPNSLNPHPRFHHDYHNLSNVSLWKLQTSALFLVCVIKQISQGLLLPGASVTVLLVSSYWCKNDHIVPSKDGTHGGTWVSGECVAAYCHICVRVWFLQSVYASMFLAPHPCVNAIFKPENGAGGIPSSTGFLKRSSAMRQIDFLPLFRPVL